jgi:poly(beta-D-mannuronate) lyase
MRKLVESVCVIVVLVGASSILGQTNKVVLNPHASFIDVPARRAELKSTKSDRVRTAVAQLASCNALASVDAPVGPMLIPPHYLKGGHGPTNPAEHEYTKAYGMFERRVTAGMNQFLATGDHGEAQCAQAQIDQWAQANALLDYDPVAHFQSWYQVEWTLSSIAISESVLLNDDKLDSIVTARDVAWMNKVAHRMIEVPSEAQHHNNHHYWRGLAAIASGVISSDNVLFNFGVQAFKDAVDEIDMKGAFPKEMARNERAIHYQSFALQPLIPIAEFAERQRVSLYTYKSASGRNIGSAVSFLDAIVADPKVVKAYTPEEQMVDSDAPDFFACLEFFAHRFTHGRLPASIAEGLKKPTFATRLGGSTTVLAGR